MERRLESLERRRGLPGLSGAAMNRDIWDSYDWSHKGEEWTSSPEWKRSLLDLMANEVPSGSAVLEIGPGGGRWTEELQKIAGTLTLVDVSQASIELCRKRFAGCSHLRYVVNDGRTLPGVQDESIDFIWSFDAFVHIAPADAAAYLTEFRRVLRKGGRALIHHPGAGGLRGGFRSRMTSELFAAILLENDLVPVQQFDSWGPGGRFDVKYFGDAITIFRRGEASGDHEGRRLTDTNSL